MNTVTVEPKRGVTALFSGFRGKLIILAAVFVATLGVFTSANAWYYQGSDWDDYYWDFPGSPWPNDCSSAVSTTLYYDYVMIDMFKSVAHNGFTYGYTCERHAAKAWIKKGGVWYETAWEDVSGLYDAETYLVKSGTDITWGWGSFQVKSNGVWSWIHDDLDEIPADYP